MTTGENKILVFFKNSTRKNVIEADIARAFNMTVSEVNYFATILQQTKYLRDSSNKFQTDIGVKSWEITDAGRIRAKEVESVPKEAKLDKISSSDVSLIYRPTKQNITPKVFEMNPVLMLAALEAPT